MRRHVRLSGLAWLALLAALVAGCADKRDVELQQRAIGGDPDRGEAAIATYGCGACHQIRGIPGAVGEVGPPLASMADRVLIAGRLPNTPDNLMRWIQHPQTVKPGTVMPDLQVSDADARDIAIYLYSLR